MSIIILLNINIKWMRFWTAYFNFIRRILYKNIRNHTISAVAKLFFFYCAKVTYFRFYCYAIFGKNRMLTIFKTTYTINFFAGTWWLTLIINFFYRLLANIFINKLIFHIIAIYWLLWNYFLIILFVIIFLFANFTFFLLFFIFFLFTILQYKKMIPIASFIRYTINI